MCESKSMINLVLEQLRLIHTMSVRGNESPHKFLFLLMLAKLYDEDPCRENCFYLNDTLEKNFIEIWLEKYPNTDHKKIFIEYPFYHLVNDKIWNLKVENTKEDIFLKYKNTLNIRFTKQRLLETIEFGYLSQDFDLSLRDQNLRKIIIKWLENKISNIYYTSLQPEKTEQIYLQDKANLQPNLFVNYLNMLHNKEANSENLAESLATNPFAGMIHISHPLIEKIETILRGNKKQHVIITGHAGDGKTTIAVELFKRFNNINLDQPLKTGLSCREDLSSKNRKISLIKDLSEWSLVDRSVLIEEMLKDDDNRFFLISNSGTLIDSFCEYEGKKGGDQIRIESEILSKIEKTFTDEWLFYDTPFTIINLSMVDNLGVAEQIFKRMINTDCWEACKMKDCQKICPIYHNVELIRQNEKVIRERLFLAYRKMYEYGTRFTLRQLTAHLAYMITSGLNYQDVEKMMQSATPPLMTNFMFFNRFFGDNGKEIDSTAQQLQAIRAIRQEDFGAQNCPKWDRYLWMQSKHSVIKLKAIGCTEEFENLRQCGAHFKFDNSLPDFQARNQARRMLYFLHDFDKDDDGIFIKTFLNSLMILNYSSWQIQSDESLSHEVNKIKKQIFHIIQEHFTGVRLPEGVNPDHDLFITLHRKSKEVRQSAQIVLARFPESDFNLCLCEKDNGVGGIRRELIFEGKKGRVDANLSLGLPFLDYVMMRNFGEVGQNLKTAYVDRLENFKGKLLRQMNSTQKDETMLIRLRANYTFRRQIFTVRNNVLEVIDG